MPARGRMVAVGLLLLPLLAGPGGAVAGGEEHPAVRVLQSDQLRVVVVDPHAPDRYYRGVRFSPVAGVLQVSMGGRNFLFAPDQHDPLKDNGGLAMEFDLFQGNSGPPGFEEAREGEGFLKVGVGVLRKTGERYRFMQPYEVLELAATTVEWSHDRAVYRQVSPEVRGLAYALDSEVRVDGRRVLVSHRLTNTGSRPLATVNYAHNFLQFDGKGSGPGYEVELFSDFQADIRKPVIERQGNRLVFTGEITPEMKAADAHIEPLAGEPLSRGLLVRHRDLRMAVAADVSIPPDRVTIHAAWTSLSPEQFIDLRLAPGQTVAWERSYTFYDTIEGLHDE